MRRFLLSPRWLAGHVLALACVLLFLRLGWLQWQVSRSARGSFQNLGYALQWPLFALFVVFAWTRIVRDAVHPPDGPATAGPGDRAGGDRASAAGAPPHPEYPHPEYQDPEYQRSEYRRPAYRRPVPAAPPPDDSDDPELAAYNRYLGWLNAKDEAG